MGAARVGRGFRQRSVIRPHVHPRKVLYIHKAPAVQQFHYRVQVRLRQSKTMSWCFFVCGQLIRRHSPAGGMSFSKDSAYTL